MTDNLFGNLNTRSGEIINHELSDDNSSSILYDVRWKGNIHFIVCGWNNFAWYYVTRNNEQISLTYHCRSFDDNTLKNIQNIIDEIEDGKYKNKKTASEKIKLIIENRKLYSLMNNTKWTKLIKSIKEEMYDIPIKYKTLFEENSPDTYWTIKGDEHFDYLNMKSVEWFKIACEIRDVRNRGRLINDEIITYNKKKEILKILENLHIPFEYDEKENAVIVYGYR